MGIGQRAHFPKTLRASGDLQRMKTFSARSQWTITLGIHTASRQATKSRATGRKNGQLIYLKQANRLLTYTGSMRIKADR
jgi:hypothetical protein